ncbi:DUF1800 domain-containing protein [Nocardia terpenica]|uniref:DUF1800 domain-containing protein n=1 Tax=Nocardia terpenica TaxID=455432 RepID=A0A291RS08_9NOCA|nr:DUF1800 domain-containing protein [Nocardia terpenica]ATL70326.1 hypothetical protein CRH09_33240 [Nocardia terpenica]
MGSQSPQWMHTARVLRRIGFGATGPEIDAVGDPVGYLRAALAADPNADPGARATPLPQFPPPAPPGRTATADVRHRYQAELNAQLTTLTGWWLRRMAAVQIPAREKLTLLWHNHFATSAVKVRRAADMAAQNTTLRTLGTGDFGTLAYAMLTDPAMLHWLDGTANTAKAPNENLAREFMELFALGHGNGYTETDVREGARALTGWTTRDTAAVFDPKRHDPGTKTVLGVTGPLGAREFCDIVLGRPESARYVAGRLWQQLASDDPPSAAALDRITAAYGPGRDLTALITAILTDPEFVSARDTVVHGPVEWAIAAVRALRVPLTDDADVHRLARVLRALGQLPFYPPDVGGWPRGQGWMSSAAAQLRLTAATVLLKKADLSPIAEAAATDRVDAAGHLLGVGAWSDRSAKVLGAARGNPARLAVLAINTPEFLTS